MIYLSYVIGAGLTRGVPLHYQKRNNNAKQAIAILGRYGRRVQIAFAHTYATRQQRQSRIIYDKAVGGSLTMTSLKIG